MTGFERLFQLRKEKQRTILFKCSLFQRGRTVITYLIRHLNIFVILQVWFSNRRAKGRRERFGDEGSQRQSISAPVCTCHTYRQPLRAPWVMETSFPTFFFPPPGYWT